MTREESIRTEGIVQEVVSGTIFRVELRNGHLVRAHLPATARAQCADLAAGDKVALELSPYDLSIARITSSQK